MWNLRVCVIFHLQYVVFMSISGQGYCKTSESVWCPEENRLYTTLFNDSYDSRQRPGNCSGEPVDVELSLWLQHILNMDTVNAVFTASSWIQLNWIDDRLVWDPEDFGGLDYLLTDVSSVWTPSLILENTATKPYIELIGSSVSKTTVSSDGNVYVDIPLLHSTVCKADTHYFPFDIQNCLVQFSAQRFPSTHVVLRTGDAIGQIGIGYTFQQWVVEKLSARSYSSVDIGKQRQQFSFFVVEFEIEIHRIPAHTLATTGCPVFILTVVGISILFIPPDSGERLSFGVSVLLGLTIFEVVVCDSIPPSFVPPLLGIFWLGSFLFVTLSVLLSYMSVNLYSRKDHIQGRFKRKLLLEILPQLCCYSVNAKVSTANIGTRNQPGADEVFENIAATNEFSSSGNEDSAVESANAVSLRTFQHSSELRKQDQQYDTHLEYTPASQDGCKQIEASTDYKVAITVLDRLLVVTIMCGYIFFTSFVLTRSP